MATNINTMLGMGLGPQDNMNALADSLRGEQRMGDYYGMSTLAPVAQMGQTMQQRAGQAAQQGGVLRQTMEKEATRQAEREQDYTRGQAADTLAQTRRLEFAAAQKKAPVSKYGKYDEYVDTKGNPRNVVAKDGLTFTQNPESGELEQTNIAGWTKPQKPTGGSSKQGYYERFGTAKQQTDFETIAKDTQNQITVFRQYLPEYGSISQIPGMGTLDNIIAKDLPAWASDEQRQQQTWWRDYKKQYENIERHKLFGSALTSGEQTAWKQSNIGPDSSPEQIQDAMDTLVYLTKKMAYKSKQNAVTKGRDADYVNNQYEWLGAEEEFVDLGPVPKALKDDPAGWNKLTYGQRAKLMKFMGSQ